MTNSSFVYKVPLNILEQSAEKLIEHNELDTAEALLKAIIEQHPQYTFAHAMLNSIKAKTTPKTISSPLTYYVDRDYHTGVFEVLRVHDDMRVAFFDTREEAEDYVKNHG